MTKTELVERVLALERDLAALKSQMAEKPSNGWRWWAEGAGRFANDPFFDQIVRQGKAYRDSLKPKRRKVKRDRS